MRRWIAKAASDPASVQIVAVTKGQPPAAAMAALRAGLVDLGENYAQELLAKHAVLASRGHLVRWHFLGAVQRNKLGKLSGIVSFYQGVCREAEALGIQARDPDARILVEVDYTGRRRGLAPDAVPEFVERLRQRGVRVVGLMTVAPQGPKDLLKEVFSSFAALTWALGLEVASGGMSDDFEVAVAAGCNMVRLGRVLFGERGSWPGGARPEASRLEQ